MASSQRGLGKPRYFDEHNSAEVVNARIGPTAEPRLAKVMKALVKHLHAAVKEIEPTQGEWMAAIKFLTDTGHMCTGWRQEFILLSDVFGVSMLVDAINHRRTGGETPNTILGPFYVTDAPFYENGSNICLDGKGEPLLVSGRITDIHGNAIAAAILDVWQTNDDGFYDVQQRGIQPVSNLRGTFTATETGSYWFRSVKPRHYPLPTDGPVGNLLRILDRQPNRAAHLHFIVRAPGYDTVITHIFTPDCEYLGEDAVFGVKKDLIADFRKVEDPALVKEAGFNGPFWKVEWDFTLASAKL